MKVQDIGDNVGVEIYLFDDSDPHRFNTLEQAKSFMKGQGLVKADEGKVIEDRLVILAYREKNM